MIMDLPTTLDGHCLDSRRTMARAEISVQCYANASQIVEGSLWVFVFQENMMGGRDRDIEAA